MVYIFIYSQLSSVILLIYICTYMLKWKITSADEFGSQLKKIALFSVLCKFFNSVPGLRKIHHHPSNATFDLQLRFKTRSTKETGYMTKKSQSNFLCDLFTPL